MRMIPMVLAVALSISGCGFLPQAPKRTDPRTVYVWPTEVCPSLAAGTPTAGRSVLATALMSTLLGNAISGIVGIPAAALAGAAEADTQGLKATGTNARFYYKVEKIAATDQVEVIQPGCYIVAFAAPAQTAKPWCSDGEFARSVPETCRVGASVLNALKVREQLTNTQPGIDTLAVPEFYAELAFEQSGTQDIVRPYVASLHYPRSVIDPNSGKPRMLSLALEFSSAQANDPMKGATISMVLPSVTPAAPVGGDARMQVITGWASIPSKLTGEPPAPKETGKKIPFMPVTIKASFNEVGDPSKFLQAFAKAFGASAGDYSKAITAEVSPAGQSTAKQDQDKKQAEFSVALATAQKSRADLLGACAANPATPQAKASAESLHTTAVANQRKANLAADVAGVAHPFAPAVTVVGVSAACWS